MGVIHLCQLATAEIEVGTLDAGKAPTRSSAPTQRARSHTDYARTEK